jgi:hypothetical protein
VLESAGAKSGKAHVIKNHQNLGGLPEEMNFKLIEPLRELFKDEVRKIGLELGLPYDMVYRHPFPGLGVSWNTPTCCAAPSTSKSCARPLGTTGPAKRCGVSVGEIGSVVGGSSLLVLTALYLASGPAPLCAPNKQLRWNAPGK